LKIAGVQRHHTHIQEYLQAIQEEVTCVGSSEPHKLGLMDKWVRVIDPKVTISESLKQQKLNKELWKERTHEVHKYIARWVYTHDSFSLLFYNYILEFIRCNYACNEH